jgi:hypothetical protein
VGVKALNQVLDGYNSTIIAFGVTGSGKTYTITGYETENASGSIGEIGSEMDQRAGKCSLTLTMCLIVLGIYARLIHYLNLGASSPDHPEI